ncbi:homoserine dehydrogenase [Pseudobacteroides cellulosolvens]|uniref:Homoserine dehydrogenase n=1 Tax=Pseudobacteroides cellulosolvens ATCC 35603 = DSM 2933 TaxID=398512 RepID=A0A0L6JTC0_9FIRM|nr:homoserine dehydrogenase [Pseudobacteroides cellulosolvens]KNY28662.1 homoserine dehydrogenase [Pseudobacteroides cellulosolvens ATCC 35603 = DSM 2933]
MKKIKVGLLGLGVVGAELANIINSNKEDIMQKYGIEMEIGKAYVRDLHKKRNADIPFSKLTDNANEVLNDSDIICECMGGSGTEATKDYVVRCIEMTKPVIMSSKKVIALYGKDIIDLCMTKKSQLRFDATVGGGIPIAKVIKECFKGEKITKAVGILNATSNYIYSSMERKGYSFEQALKKAQDLGYAENDPSEDINGFDALYKVIVLALFAMKSWVNIKEMSTKSFSSIDIVDMKYAQDLGYKIKPLAIFQKKKDKKFVYRVGPCLIAENHIAANVINNFNIIVFEGSNSGKLGFYGQGAGSKPTASAMYDDLVSVLKTSFDYEMDLYDGCDVIHDYRDFTNSLYWRVSVDNIIGKLALICNVFAKNSVNIEKVIQKDEVNGKMDVVLLTNSVESTVIDLITHEFENNKVDVNTIIPFFND